MTPNSGIWYGNANLTSRFVVPVDIAVWVIWAALQIRSISKLRIEFDGQFTGLMELDAVITIHFYQSEQQMSGNVT